MKLKKKKTKKIEDENDEEYEDDEEEQEQTQQEFEPTPVINPKQKLNKKAIWQIGTIATQTQPVIVNTRTQQSIDLYEAIALILNALEDIKRGLM